MKMIQPNELVEGKLYLLGSEKIRHKYGEPFKKYDIAIYLGELYDSDCFYIFQEKRFEYHNWDWENKIYDFIFEP